MIKAYFFLKKNRLRKKWHIYRLLFAISLDFTTVFYLILLVGYFGVAVYSEGNFSFPEIALPFEIWTKERLLSLALVLPVVFVVNSFREPGVMFTSAEYTLTILPFARGRVWLLAAMEKWIKMLAIFLIVGLAVFYFTPVNFSAFSLFILLLLGLQVMMTPIQWKLFQMKFYWKIALLLLLGLFQIGAIFWSPLKVAILANSSLFVLSLFATRHLFVGVDWKRVTAAGDFAVWNMPIISQATKVKFKKERQLGLWQRFTWWKKSFTRKQGAYQRLWYLYIEKQLGLIFQFSGVLFVLLIVSGFLNDWLFWMMIALTIHMQATFLASLFKDRLQSDLVAALPWDVHCFNRTFLTWALLISSILLLPLGIYAIMHYSYEVLVQIGLSVLLFYIFIQMKLEQVILSWNHNHLHHGELFAYGLLLLFVVAGKISFVQLLSLPIIGIYFWKGKRLLVR